MSSPASKTLGTGGWLIKITRFDLGINQRTRALMCAINRRGGGLVVQAGRRAHRPKLFQHIRPLCANSCHKRS